jgi:hypothetical protein
MRKTPLIWQSDKQEALRYHLNQLKMVYHASDIQV